MHSGRHPKLIERMLAIKQPYNVNVAAEAMARAGTYACRARRG
jgi:histidinol-phosphate/aromatic aminotransferase/cobyric acid decarboxylase-like protein